MLVRSALQLVHQVSDEVRGEDESEVDSDTRFAVTWFESHGFDEGPYGEAETLATARAVSVRFRAFKRRTVERASAAVMPQQTRLPRQVS